VEGGVIARVGAKARARSFNSPGLLGASIERVIGMDVPLSFALSASLTESRGWVDEQGQTVRATNR